MPVSAELLEILACPIDKEDVIYHKDYDFIQCEKCDIRVPADMAKGKDVCAKCGGAAKKIKGEVLICSKCNRWYPIIDDIPHMLPDDLREDLV
jgi:uncharacterized protein YbaR (Trm112 family)